MRISHKNYPMPEEIALTEKNGDQWQDFRFKPARSFERNLCFEVLSEEYEALRAHSGLDVLAVDIQPGGELEEGDDILAMVGNKVHLLRWVNEGCIRNFAEGRDIDPDSIEWILGPVVMTAHYFSAQQLRERGVAA